MFNKFTRIPNFFFDLHLPTLNLAELKLVLCILRQTNGWKDKRTGERKLRDRIMVSQFIKKTGLGKRAITKSLQTLVNKDLIQITDYNGTILRLAKYRKGKSYLYYTFLQPTHFEASTNAQKAPKPAHQRMYNKSNRKKINETKATPSFMGHISTLLTQSSLLLNGAKT